MRFFYTFLAAGVLFAIPFVSFGDTTGLVPECSGGGPFCQACDLLELVQNLINFAVYAATLVATLMFVYAGFLYVTASAAGQEQFKKARNIFVNVFIGFVVILIAWLVVDLIMKTFLGETGGTFGPWNQIECAEYGRVELPNGPGGGVEVGGTRTENGKTFANPGIQEQYDQGHASPQLNSLIECMARSTNFTITSISDNQIINGDHTWDECRQGQCQHSSSSWHYGGSTGNNLSYAVDIRTNDRTFSEVQSIRHAATRCGGRSVVEGTHLHVTAPSR